MDRVEPGRSAGAAFGNISVNNILVHSFSSSPSVSGERGCSEMNSIFCKLSDPGINKDYYIENFSLEGLAEMITELQSDANSADSSEHVYIFCMFLQKLAVENMHARSRGRTWSNLQLLVDTYVLLQIALVVLNYNQGKPLTAELVTSIEHPFWPNTPSIASSENLYLGATRCISANSIKMMPSLMKPENCPEELFKEILLFNQALWRNQSAQFIYSNTLLEKIQYKIRQLYWNGTFLHLFFFYVR